MDVTPDAASSSRDAPETGAVVACDGAIVTERPFRALVNLRGDARDPAFASGARECLGLAQLPIVNAWVATAGGFVAWLGPDELLVAGEPGGERTLVERLRTHLSGLVVAITDVTCGYTTLAIEGPRARDLIARGCPLDLHPRVFEPGRCAQTHIAKANVLIAHKDATPAFEVVVRRSFAEYLWRWLRASCAADPVTRAIDASAGRRTLTG